MKEWTVLVADRDARHRRFAEEVLSRGQWQVLQAGDGAAALAQARDHCPVLILIGDGLPPGEGAATLAALRAESPPLRSAAILAFCDNVLPDERLWRLGFDGCVAPTGCPETLLAAAEDWRPGDELAGAQRLVELFGAEAIVPMIARFCAQLAAAVATLGRAPSPDDLHRIAGIAGTLGFDRVSSSWEQLSRGDAATLSVARREGRRVVAQIERDRRFATLG